MREEKPDVQGRCCREPKFCVKTEKFSTKKSPSKPRFEPGTFSYVGKHVTAAPPPSCRCIYQKQSIQHIDQMQIVLGRFRRWVILVIDTLYWIVFDLRNLIIIDRITIHWIWWMCIRLINLVNINWKEFDEFNELLTKFLWIIARSRYIIHNLWIGTFQN